VLAVATTHPREALVHADDICDDLAAVAKRLQALPRS
jgi:hypothetical protein